MYDADYDINFDAITLEDCEFLEGFGCCVMINDGVVTGIVPEDINISFIF